MWDQVLVGADPGDAITNNAVQLHDRLNDFGPSRIYAEHIQPGVAAPVLPLGELAGRPNRGRPLIFHASMGSWPVFKAIRDEPELILIYHNLSPFEAFVDLAPQVAGDLVRGRWELEQIRDRVRLAIADSEFNARELREMGYRGVEVVAPTPDVMRLERLAPDGGVLADFDRRGTGPHVLCVAQQMPHKRIERVLATMAILQQDRMPDARLTVVGSERFPLYSASLSAFSRSLGLRDVWFAGRVSEEALAACYLRASAFLTLSDHEGFCIPAVEAMALGVPVVAGARGALPETIGDAGVLLDDPDDVQLAARVLATVLEDGELRRRLIGRGHGRAQELDSRSSLPHLTHLVVRTDPDLLRRFGRG